MKVFSELKERLKEIIKVDEFAYLTVKDEVQAFAFYKADSELFSLAEWKKFHQEDYPTIIAKSPVLVDLVKNKKYVAVENTHALEVPQKEFQILNIYSIYLFPVLHNNLVVGFVDIAYIGDYYIIDKGTLDKIQCLVCEYSEKILQTVEEYSK
ncbi:hypothetical protein [Clostridium oryzae]|uniref:GAF domain-containing protein n=1 Tax=Clostridium oryzae TaxID=1450648 RepID=A0A1V4IWV5_9CLOT|nr:hypothetical protein [Clostridium oryzae]OPJ64436.1 hypothetical protein CLORY_06300 [Clostridium oryzae]